MKRGGHVGGFRVPDDMVDFGAGVGGETVGFRRDVVPAQTVEQLRNAFGVGRVAVAQPVVDKLLRAFHVLVADTLPANQGVQRTACVGDLVVDRRVIVPEVVEIAEGLRLLDVKGEIAHADTAHPVLRHNEILVCNLLPDGVNIARMLVELLLIPGDKGV